MVPSDSRNAKFSTWSVPGSPIAIEYSLVVIEEIRHEVMAGYQKAGAGGLGVGGALYGTRDGHAIRIEAMRPIACEHAAGPAFVLSPSDRAALELQLQNDLGDPRLDGMVCVGWFVSHTRGEIMLSDSDLELYTASFGAPWQVALVIRPGRAGSMRAGFFVRETDGAVNAAHSYLEFNFPDRLAGVLDRPPRSDRRTFGERRSSGIAEAVPLGRETEPVPQSLEGPELLAPPHHRAKWPWLVGWAAVVIALAVIGLRYYYYMTEARPEPMALSVFERDGQLRIEWNHAAKPVASATRGSLAINDGKDSRNVPLTPQDLARGSFTYPRKSGDVHIGLTVANAKGKTSAEETWFLGPPASETDPNELKTLQQQRDELQAEVNRLRRDNAAQAQRVQELQRTLRILQARMGIK